MTACFVKYVSVILDISIDKSLDYGITAELLPFIKRGMQVEVPVKGKLRSGYVYAIKDHADYPKVKAVERVISETELINDELFELSLWMAKYYCATMRDVLQIMLPAIVRKEVKHKEQLFVMRAQTREQLKAHCEKVRNTHPAQAGVLDVMLKVKKGILLSELLHETQGSRSPVDTLTKQGYLIVDVVRIDRSPLVNEEYFQTKPRLLSEEQSVALSKIVKSLSDGRFESHLLHGVTGSGKTEVYLQAIDFALKQGKGIIMLVPEISLTTQTIERFRSRFEGKIAVLHHRLSQGERYDEWHKIRRGESQIVIGARSAVFSPVNNLGLIIVDEEHENSYKQGESSPCYHAREVAVMRGKLTGSTVVLGTATPSLESFYNVSLGKYTLSSLNKRADAAAMPKFSIIDMKSEYTKAKGYTSFSEVLLNGIKIRREKGEQTILFLNRRGYHTTLLCQGCSKPVGCPHCDIALTFHLNEDRLACHLCGFHISPPPKQCPLCKHSETMKFRGVGTEQVEKALHAVLPEVRTLRIDADTTRHKGSHQKLLREFGTGKADVLIGTQMIAKGLHFPEVTLVGVLNSDASLNIPDFRASETVFQLITQVAGRAGRGNICGEVIVQTNLPDNHTIRLAASQDYEKFYEEEIGVRKLFNYPPFSSMVKLTFSGDEVGRVRQFAENFRFRLIEALPADFELHPVVPSGYAKIKNKFRFQLIVRGPSVYPISGAIDTVRQAISYGKGISLLIDVNPTSTFF